MLDETINVSAVELAWNKFSDLENMFVSKETRIKENVSKEGL